MLRLLVGGRDSAGRVARQPALAGLEELLRPAVIHRSGDAFTAAKLRDVLLTAQPFQHDANLLFRRVLPAGLTPNVLQHPLCRGVIRPRFLFHLRSFRPRWTRNPPLPESLHLSSRG